MNMHNRKKFIGVVVGFLTLSLMTLNTSAESTKTNGERTTNPIWVECLADEITIDYIFTNVISETMGDTNWNYTRRSRQSGSAVDSSGNSWSFRGGYTVTEHVSLSDSGDVTKFHWLNKDILIADKDNTVGNLILSWRLRGVFDYGTGEFTVREESESVSCM